MGSFSNFLKICLNNFCHVLLYTHTYDTGNSFVKKRHLWSILLLIFSFITRYKKRMVTKMFKTLCLKVYELVIFFSKVFKINTFENYILRHFITHRKRVHFYMVFPVLSARFTSFEWHLTTNEKNPFVNFNRNMLNGILLKWM